MTLRNVFLHILVLVMWDASDNCCHNCYSLIITVRLLAVMTELSLPAMYDLGLSYSYCNYFNWIMCIIGTTHVKFDYHFKCLLKCSTMSQHWNTKCYCVCRGTEAEPQGINKTLVKQIFIVGGMWLQFQIFMKATSKYFLGLEKGRCSQVGNLFSYSEICKKISNVWLWETLK